VILILGGTTEGRMAVKTLDEAGSPFFYSTRGEEQEVVMHHGTRLSGAMDGAQLQAFCRSHDIKLLVDAGHPFATQLHETVANTAAQLQLPAIRLERIYPAHTSDITWCNTYEEAKEKILSKGIKRLLVLTGVQTIAKLQSLLSEGVACHFRILRRQSSIDIAHKLGITDEALCFYQMGDADHPLDNEEDEVQLMEQLHPDAIITKESGNSGGFMQKVEAAKQLGIQVFAVCRPATPPYFHKVNGPYGLRRMVEQLLPEFFPLHSGLTTGTCATAAAIAATLQRFHGQTPPEVPVVLPNGETIPVPVHYAADFAYVIKDSGDDPDITKGMEIRASVVPSDKFEIKAGEGIGTITLPGFDYPPGSPAINRVPREMLRHNIQEQVCITLSIPGGAEIARRTFNPRLGIEGGISVIGVSGIIMPFSLEGFINSIRKCMQVARATGCERVVINSGAKSEGFVKAYYPDLPPQVFVEYGNFIGETIRAAHEEGFRQLTLGIMIGKAVKLAAGHLDTHSKHVVMDTAFIRELAAKAGCPENILETLPTLNMARDLWKLLPASTIKPFARLLIQHCHDVCAPLFPDGKLEVLLISEQGEIYTENPTTSR